MTSERVVFVVDDDEAVRDSLGFLLEAAGHLVRTFDNPLAVAAEIDHRTGCVITDVRMPDISGLELVDQLKARNPGLPIVVITGHADVAMAVEAMKSGASDFLEKPFEDETLLAIVDRLVASDSSPAIGDADAVDRLASLSHREKQVLNGLMAGSGNKEIARDLAISPRTVEIYRAKVMAKMHADTYADLIRTGIRAGLG